MNEKTISDITSASKVYNQIKEKATIISKKEPEHKNNKINNSRYTTKESELMIKHILTEFTQKIEDNKSIITSELPLIKKQIRTLMENLHTIAKYNNKKDESLNISLDNFYTYSKTIENEIDLKINKNNTLLKNTLNNINEFMKNQKSLKTIEVEDNTKEHRQLKADILILKEEFPAIIDEYKEISGKIIELQKGQINNEEIKNLSNIMKSIKTDIINIDKVLDSEKENIKVIISEMLDSRNKEINTRVENALNNSKTYTDEHLKNIFNRIHDITTKNKEVITLLKNNEKKDITTDNKFSEIIGSIKSKIESKEKEINEKLNNNQKESKNQINEQFKQLFKGLNKISTKNIELINIVKTAEDNSDKQQTEMIDTISQLIDTKINIFENQQKETTNNLKNNQDKLLKQKETEAKNQNTKNIEKLTTLLKTYEARDAEREKRMTNMFKLIETSVQKIKTKTTSKIIDETVGNELDSMITDLKKIQQESN